MLHLGSSTKLPDTIKGPSSQQGQASSKPKELAKRPKVIQVSSLDQLTFERFLHTDMRKFYSQVVDIKDSLFGATEYVVEIRISNISPFKVGKTYEQFRAFYKALKLRFPNIMWPEFPPNFQLVKKVETRKAAFNHILEEICIVARMQDTYKKSILGIFFAFFLDQNVLSKAKIDHPQKASENKDPNRPKIDNHSVIESQNDAETTQQLEDRIKAHLGDCQSENYEPKTPDVASLDDIDKKLEGDKAFSERKVNERSPIENGTQRRLSFEHYTTPQVDGSEKKEESRKSAESESSRRASIDEEGHLENVQAKIKLLNNSPDQNSNEDSKIERSRSFESANHVAATADTLNELENLSHNEVSKEHQDSGENDTQAPRHSNSAELSQEPLVQQKSIRKYTQEEVTTTVVEVPKRSHEVDGLVHTRQTSIEQKERDLETLERLERKKMVKMDMEKILKKEVPRFSGNIYIRISSSSKWIKYFARIQNSCLLLYPTILDNFPHHFIPCFRAVVKYVENPFGSDYIEFYHYYDAEKLQIVIDINSQNQNDSIDPIKNLKVWAAQLKIASEKVTDINLSENYFYQPVGKLQLVICDVLGVKNLPNRSSCFVRISHKPFILQTSKALTGPNMKWKQSFFIPICDLFFPITIELLCAYNDGWITESQREEVICSVEIPVQDLLSLSSQESLEVELPFKYTEARKPKPTKGTSTNETDIPKLKIKVNNVSSVKSYFAPSYGDYVEGVKIDGDTFTKQLLKLSLARVRRIISYMILITRDIRGVFHHKYPFFSYICLLLLTYCIAFFQVSDMISYLLLSLAILCFSKHPKVEPKIKSFMVSHFFEEKSLNPYYKRPLFQTLSELDLLETFNIDKWKYKLIDDESLVSQIKKAKKSVVILTVVLTKISGFFEKMKNLVMWQDYGRSMLFSIFALIGYCIFAIVPLRAVIMIAVWMKFIKGIFYFKNLRAKNKQAAIAAIHLVMKKYFPDWYKQAVNDHSMPWPTGLNLVSNQKKIIEQLKYRLEIHLNDDTLQLYKNTQDLSNAIATCDANIKLKEDITEQEMNEMLHRKEPKFKAGQIFNFIMNVPSDYYRVIQPKVIQIDAKKES